MHSCPSGSGGRRPHRAGRPARRRSAVPDRRCAARCSAAPSAPAGESAVADPAAALEPGHRSLHDVGCPAAGGGVGQQRHPDPQLGQDVHSGHDRARRRCRGHLLSPRCSRISPPAPQEPHGVAPGGGDPVPARRPAEQRAAQPGRPSAAAQASQLATSARSARPGPPASWRTLAGADPAPYSLSRVARQGLAVPARTISRPLSPAGSSRARQRVPGRPRRNRRRRLQLQHLQRRPRTGLALVVDRFRARWPPAHRR